MSQARAGQRPKSKATLNAVTRRDGRPDGETCAAPAQSSQLTGQLAMGMANTAAAYGFKRWGGQSSTPQNFGFASGQPIPGSTTAYGYRISSGYATAIYFGDAVRMNVSGPTGYVEQWANGDGATATKILVGIFLGCEYYSSSQKKTIFNNYWPGSDATGDVRAYIEDDSNSLWQVQAGVAGTAFSNIYIGSTADIVATPLGNATTGISGMSLSTPTTTNTLPFKVVGLVTSPPGPNGNDPTTAFNNVIVGFNNQMFKALLGV
jgi:hypothetical protein